MGKYSSSRSMLQTRCSCYIAVYCKMNANIEQNVQTGLATTLT